MNYPVKPFFKKLILILLAYASLTSCNRELENEKGLNQPGNKEIAITAPSVKNNWSLEDIMQFNKYLENLEDNELPKLNNPNSKDLFSKFIGSVPQPYLSDSSIEISQKMQLVMRLNPELKKVLLKYSRAHSTQNDYSLELVHIIGINLIAAKQMVNVGNEFISLLDSNSTDYSTRMEGLEQVRLGVNLQLKGAIYEVENKEKYNPEERIILMNYINQSAPVLLFFLKEGSKTEFRNELEKFMERENNKEIKDIISLLLNQF